MAGWNADTAAGPLGVGTVTLVEGSSFSISLQNGDMHPELPHGLFVQDTRILSCWSLTINGHPLEPLAAEMKEPYRALFACRVPRSDGYADSPLIVERLREVGVGIHEQVTIGNYSLDPVDCVVSLNVEADFADLFEVKEARVQRRWDQSRHQEGDTLTIRAVWQDVRKGVAVRASGADLGGDTLTYRVSVPPHGEWSATFTVSRSWRGRILKPYLSMPMSTVYPPVTAVGGNGWPRFRWCRWEIAPLNELGVAVSTTWVPFASRIPTIRTGSSSPLAHRGL